MYKFFSNTSCLRLCVSAFILYVLVVFSNPAAAQTHKEFLLSLDRKVSENIVTKGQWYPSYHFTSNGSRLAEVAALGYFKDKYRLFYLHSPLNSEGKNNYWGQAESTDLIHWKKIQSSIAPYDYYDKTEILGGSSIVLDDLLFILYTGKGDKDKASEETQTDENRKNMIVSTQNLAMSKDGFNFGKSANNPVMKSVTINKSHEFSDENFANPYVWERDGEYYALVGSQYKATKDGAVLLYKSKDLRNWSIVNVAAIGQKGEMGYMWESPAMFSHGGYDVLTISPKGIKPHGKLFLNKNQSGAFVGKLDYNTGKFSQNGAFMLYDYGFDFYAPKFIVEKGGRVICIAMLGMEGTQRQEDSENWSGVFTIPREVKVVNGKLHTVPAKEIEQYRGEKHVFNNVTFSGEKEFFGIKGSSYELNTTVDLTNANNFSIKLREDVSNETVLSYDKTTKVLKLNRDKSGNGLSGEREVVLPLYQNKLHLHIFVDKSSVEVFANNGPVAMSSRIYPDKGAVGIKFISEGETKIEELEFYKLKTVE